MNPRRRRLLDEMRALLGVAYENAAAVPTDGVPPDVVDCSGLVRWVCQEVLGGDGRLSPGEWVPTARTMFARLRRVNDPEPADLALYSRDDAERGEVWHVMMVTESGG
jgi:cell wall-associated NlpC family hydrolase